MMMIMMMMMTVGQQVNSQHQFLFSDNVMSPYAGKLSSVNADRIYSGGSVALRPTFLLY